MKQKYRIVRDPQTKKLAILEYAELDTDSMSLVCEQSYEDDAIELALANGGQDLTALLRSHHIFPPAAYMAEIINCIGALYNAGESTAAEVMFDDLDYISKKLPKAANTEDSEKESGQLDKLLEDDFEENYTAKESLGPPSAPLKITEDDNASTEEEPFFLEGET